MFRPLPSITVLLMAAGSSVVGQAQGILHDPTLPPPGYQAVLPAAKLPPIETAPPVPPVQIRRLDPAPAVAGKRKPPASDASVPGRVISVTSEAVVVQAGASKQTLPAASAVKKKVIPEK